MNKINLSTLSEMYLIHSPSKREGEFSSFVQGKLKEMKIDFETLDNQIYSIYEDAPVLIAHLDQVDFPKKTDWVTIQNGIISGNGNLGCDDKNGVYTVLRLLEKHPNQLGFIFSCEEETGGKIDDVLDLFGKDELSDVPYALIFDRRNGSDIVGTFNHYCEHDLIDDVLDLLQPLGYREIVGMWSDGDLVNEYLPCINLSVGYYKAHSEQEYTVISQLDKAYEAGKILLDGLKLEPYKRPDTTWTKWRSYQYPYTHGNYIDSSQYTTNYDMIEWNEDEDIDTDIFCPNCYGYDIDPSPFLYGEFICFDCDTIFSSDGWCHYQVNENWIIENGNEGIK